HSQPTTLPPPASLSISLPLLRPPSSPLFPYTTLFRSTATLTAFTVQTTVDIAAQGVHISETASVSGAASVAITTDFSLTSGGETDRKSTRLNSSHDQISYAVFCLKKKKKKKYTHR